MISVVTGTLNRIKMLKGMVGSVRNAMRDIPFEFVIVDGGSEDGTENWCLEQKDIVFVQQKRRLGAIRAFNAGFAKAQYKHVCNLNDDCEVVGDVFQDAIKQLESDNTIGQIAIPYGDNGNVPKCEEVRVGHSAKVLYANFGITRRWLGEHIGWWGTNYSHYAGDTECSVRIWDAGYRVVQLDGSGHIKHHRAQDDTRMSENVDSPIFYSKWAQWNGPKEKPVIFEN